MASVTRWHSTMTGLLYPAFLGNLTYLAFETALAPEPFLATASGVLIVVLVVHYVFDFDYTLTHKSIGAYGAGQFALDLAIVACLYLAIRTAIAQHVGVPFADWQLAPTLWLFLTKVLATGWEAYDAGRGSWDCSKKVAVGLDASFGVAYLAFFVLDGAGGPPHLVAAVVALDAAAYMGYEWLTRSCGVARAAPAPVKGPPPEDATAM